MPRDTTARSRRFPRARDSAIVITHEVPHPCGTTGVDHDTERVDLARAIARAYAASAPVPLERSSHFAEREMSLEVERRSAPQEPIVTGREPPFV